MIDYLRLGGAALILLAALFIGREYSVYVKKRISELRGFRDLLVHLQSKISKFLCYGVELFGDFTSEALEKCGFLAKIREGESPNVAFRDSCARMSLSENEEKIIYEFFDGFGREYREGELKRIEGYTAQLEERLNASDSELTKNVKITNALLLGGGLALIILVI